MRVFFAITAFVLFALPQAAPASSRTEKAAHCAKWNAACVEGCKTNPGRTGDPKLCAQQVCGERLNNCMNDARGCYWFRTMPSKCLGQAESPPGKPSRAGGGIRPEPVVQATPPTILTYAIKEGETVPLGSAYWIANCRSILNKFIAIDILEGPPSISLSFKPGMVHAIRQKCPKPVEGATLMATAKGIKEPVTMNLTYRIRYDTRDGERQSTHTIQLKLYP